MPLAVADFSLMSRLRVRLVERMVSRRRSTLSMERDCGWSIASAS